jgi:hypothetical protein
VYNTNKSTPSTISVIKPNKMQPTDNSSMNGTETIRRLSAGDRDLLILLSIADCIVKVACRLTMTGGFLGVH